MRGALSHDFCFVVLFPPMFILISISGSLEGDETRMLSHDGLTEEAGVLFSLCTYIELADYTPGPLLPVYLRPLLPLYLH